MDLSKLAKTVVKFAPALGAVLPIPGGAAIGTAIAAAFGGDINNEKELIKKIELDPEAQVKLEKIQADKEVELKKLLLQDLDSQRNHETQLQKISADDRDSARDRQVELAQAGQIDHTPRNLAYIIIVGFFVTVFYIPFLPIDTSDKEVMMLLVGVLAGKFGSVIDFYFGAAAEKFTHFFKKASA